MRHLRLYRFDVAGRRIPTAGLSSALMPAAVPEGAAARAGELTFPGHEARRLAAVDVLIAARSLRRETWGIALVCCPDRGVRLRRVALTPTTAYLGSFAAVAPTGLVWTGDAMREELSDLVRYLEQCVRHVRQSERAPAWAFTPASA